MKPVKYKEVWATLERDRLGVSFWSKEPVWDKDTKDWDGVSIISLQYDWCQVSTRIFIEKLFGKKLYRKKPVRLI